MLLLSGMAPQTSYQKQDLEQSCTTLNNLSVQSEDMPRRAQDTIFNLTKHHEIVQDLRKDLCILKNGQKSSQTCIEGLEKKISFLESHQYELLSEATLNTASNSDEIEQLLAQIKEQESKIFVIESRNVEIQGKNEVLARENELLKSSIKIKMEKLEGEESRDSGRALADLAFNLTSAHLKREKDFQSKLTITKHKLDLISKAADACVKGQITTTNDAVVKLKSFSEQIHCIIRPMEKTTYKSTNTVQTDPPNTKIPAETHHKSDINFSEDSCVSHTPNNSSLNAIQDLSQISLDIKQEQFLSMDHYVQDCNLIKDSRGQNVGATFLMSQQSNLSSKSKLSDFPKSALPTPTNPTLSFSDHRTSVAASNENESATYNPPASGKRITTSLSNLTVPALETSSSKLLPSSFTNMNTSNKTVLKSKKLRRRHCKKEE